MKRKNSIPIAYYDSVRALPWKDVLARLGGTAHPRPDGSMWVSCVFHAGDRTPSLQLRPLGWFHCYGCGIEGDVFRFVESIRFRPGKRLESRAAAKFFTRHFGIPNPFTR